MVTMIHQDCFIKDKQERVDVTLNHSVTVPEQHTMIHMNNRTRDSLYWLVLTN